MATQREYGWNPSQFPLKYVREQQQRERKETDLEALMEAAPFTEAAPTREQSLGLVRLIDGAIERAGLDEFAKLVLHALYTNGLSLREAAQELGVGKSTIARTRDAALKKLKEVLDG